MGCSQKGSGTVALSSLLHGGELEFEENIMGMRINTNIAAINGQRALEKANNDKSASFEKLASGQRINKAGDDAAGLAISEKLKAHIRGTKQAERNASDGISMIQVAEGGMNEVSNILVRLRELSVQAASDTVGDVERGFTDKEYQHLVSEVDRIANSTSFNGTHLLKGEGDALEFQVGIHNDAENDRLSYAPEDTNASASAIGIDGTTVSSKADAQGNLEKIDEAIATISSNRAGLGALQNRLSSTVNSLQIQNENLSAANSRIRDTDYAQATADMTKGNILTSSGTSVLAQANVSQQGALKLIG